MKKQHDAHQIERTKEKYIEKIMPVLRKQGITTLKMDDISRHMDISKATLYKYFSSKDEIMERVVAVYTGYMVNADTITNENLSFHQRFQKIYEQSMLIAIYISDAFLMDLKNYYPHLFETISQARFDRITNLKQFFDEGIDLKVFQNIHYQMFMLQDDVVLRKIMDPILLNQLDLTLKQSLFEYYTLKKLQLFKQDHLEDSDNEFMKNTISQIVKKISMHI
ncbi:TetR/AcrR family transcriptional regulator [Hazenella sp. IB182357]|uniref:TetR/AcrR family transcriptional regulator n=1 Tax=Polycladospora coralii TaxID=2771432 RepID=A0A926NEU6_9BACL|nr:TetR/AcrR family transcriptional regulator [Polycladospora coralii]MBD1372249.1 TetR/AcrR family transcriptional regulator [Polycladospora coralii]